MNKPRKVAGKKHQWEYWVTCRSVVRRWLITTSRLGVSCMCRRDADERHLSLPACWLLSEGRVCSVVVVASLRFWFVGRRPLSLSLSLASLFFGLAAGGAGAFDEPAKFCSLLSCFKNTHSRLTSLTSFTSFFYLKLPWPRDSEQENSKHYDNKTLNKTPETISEQKNNFKSQRYTLYAACPMRHALPAGGAWGAKKRQQPQPHRTSHRLSLCY